ncbi:hypothetical protein [Halovivax limisalsi]|uniref:hypothetical protein n=1 Tax=Halovivax limisalsi TaxID=1453760 RepID=UPI001FFC617B|nr:hypothetical protein [Halovivax limisalsi]
MTDETTKTTRGATDDSRRTGTQTGDSRRSFVKKGALASTALALGASGTAAAQDDDDDDLILDDNWEGLIHITNFYPDARFTFVSGVVEWVPNYGDVTDSWFEDYNTHQIRWLNTGEVVPLFVAHDAEIGEYDEDLGYVSDTGDDQNQPQLYQMSRDWSPFGDNQEFIAIQASPVEEEEEDSILEHEDWWQTDGNGGGNGNGAGTENGNETTTGNVTGNGNETTTGNVTGNGNETTTGNETG